MSHHLSERERILKALEHYKKQNKDYRRRLDRLRDETMELLRQNKIMKKRFGLKFNGHEDIDPDDWDFVFIGDYKLDRRTYSDLSE